MNPFYDLYKFYEDNTSILGKKFQKAVGKDGKDTKYYFFKPIGFTQIKPKYVFEITDSGTLHGIVDESVEKLVPVSLKSATRSSNIAPHILSDKVAYFKEPNKKGAYLNQAVEVTNLLKQDCPELVTVFNYILSNDVYLDLETHIKATVLNRLKTKSKVPTVDEIQKEEEKEFKGILNEYISFRLIYKPDYFESDNFLNLWQKFHIDSVNQSSDYEYGLDYITGNIEKITDNVAGYDGTKKFTSVSKDTVKEQFEKISPSSIGYITFEKAMASLNFLKLHQSVNMPIGNSRKMILLEKSNNKVSAQVNNVFSDLLSDVLNFSNKEKSYQKDLYSLIIGKNANLLSDNFMVITVDNFTKGRSAIIDYHPLTLDYLQNLSDYANNVSCSTWNVLKLMYPKKTNYTNLISLDHKVLFNAIKNGQPIPTKVYKSHFRVLINPNNTVYKENEDKLQVWQRNLNIFEKLYLYKREDLPKMLDKNYNSRSYLFGRALAVYHHVESRSKDASNKNNTISMKYFSMMQKSPAKTLMVIKNRTSPYFRKEKYAKYFEDILLEITDKFEIGEFNKKESLSEDFLLGFNHQLKALRTK